jgi:hypothetical protein
VFDAEALTHIDATGVVIGATIGSLVSSVAGSAIRVRRGTTR